jgi:hypothetical protein
MESFSIAPPGGGSRSRKPDDPLLGHCDLGAVAAGVRFHHWRLGFRQFSFRPITRVLQDHVFSVFQHLLLLGHAVFPSGFRLQVNPMTQKRPSEFLLTESGIQHYVPRRTLSPHTALRQSQAFRPSHRLAVVKVVVLLWMIPSVFSAFRISRTSIPLGLDYLSPFAMWSAFPTADYYGDSVALGLAPVRQSRDSWIQYVRA